MNVVTNVSAKLPHNPPVVDLAKIGQTEVWSLEQAEVFMPSSPFSHPSDNLIDTNTIFNINNNSYVRTRWNVADWDIHDFTYRLCDEVDNDFFRCLAIFQSQSLHRVTFTSLSPHLSSQLFVSNVSANGQLLTSHVNETTNNPFLGTYMYKKHQVYVKDREQQLAAATEKLRLTDMDVTSFNTTDDVNAQFSSRDVHQPQPQQS